MFDPPNSMDEALPRLAAQTARHLPGGRLTAEDARGICRRLSTTFDLDYEEVRRQMIDGGFPDPGCAA
ncbi:hypothetical protein [Haematobacter massiliensis]|uniref:hypothetical protein n=1 Tax=Haematobacter massiliensis TaxID=195105 RepID=UPI0023F31D23|nr:hypothetical protein [Haematobacter massiliensis]